nr:MAG TPA: hypothetical protein [Caudoviricetes sp.]
MVWRGLFWIKHIRQSNRQPPLIIYSRLSRLKPIRCFRVTN